jgi:hypothetical protein
LILKKSFLLEELVLSLVVSRDALISVLIDKGVFTKGEFPEMVQGGGWGEEKGRQERRNPPPFRNAR